MADKRFIYVAAVRNRDVGAHGKKYRFDTASGDTLWIDPVDIYGYDVVPDKGEKDEPAAPQRKSVLTVVFLDGGETTWPTPRGIMFNPQHRTIRIIGGATIPLDNVRYWTQEMR